MGFKRPFGLTQETERRKYFKIISDYGKGLVTKEEKLEGYEEKNYWTSCSRFERYPHIKVSYINPIKKISLFRRACLYETSKDTIEGCVSKEFYYEIGYDLILELKNRIRLYGDEESMGEIIKIFGKGDGIKILEIFCRRNLLVAKIIKQYMDKLQNV